MTESEALLSFWFGDDLDDEATVAARCAAWFASDPTFDAAIQARFAAFPERAAQGDFSDWSETPRGALALVIALDQLPRNLHRGRARAFSYDGHARKATEAALERQYDLRVHPLEAIFFYLPLEHAEDRDAQRRSVDSCEALLARAPAATRSHFENFVDYARRHQAVISRFGRFPHRNAALGRESHESERAYLAGGGETF